MHELGIVFSIIERVEQVGRENGLQEVASVTLELGEVSTVVDTYLRDCWNWAVAKSALLCGAALRTEVLPAVTRCNGCERTYSTVSYGKICPHCGSSDTNLITGNEISIKEIEAC